MNICIIISLLVSHSIGLQQKKENIVGGHRSEWIIYSNDVVFERECRNFKECLVDIDFKVKAILMKDYMWRQGRCSDNRTVIPGVTMMTLLSGMSWELFDNPSKSKSFSKEERKSYRIFRNEWMSRGELPYEMVDKIEVIEEILTEEKIKCLEVNYIIKPDSTGKLEITEREILYSAE